MKGQQQAIQYLHDHQASFAFLAGILLLITNLPCLAEGRILTNVLVLSNAGFETYEGTSGGPPSSFRNWAGDYSRVLSAPDQGISPRSGTGMLRFLGTGATGPSATANSSQVWQLVDAAPLSAYLPDGVITVTLSFFVNRVPGDDETDKYFSATLKAHAGSPAAFPSAGSYLARSPSVALHSDSDPGTWEQVTTSMRLPAGTSYLSVEIWAYEDVVNDAVLPEFDGHYVDDVSIQVWFEPYFPGALTLVPSGAVWRYLDNGSDQGTEWRGTTFNDTGWAAGRAQLGYGEGDEATTISFGPDPANKYITTYFRNTFTVDNLAGLTNLAVRLLRDDGAIVYLNGAEVFRSNMPDGPMSYDSRAYGTWVYEDTRYSSPVPPALLLSGTNILAVELHQVSPPSSDVSFDLELLANTPLGIFPPAVAISNPTNGAIFIPGQTFTVTASSTDGDGHVTRLDLFLDSERLGIFPKTVAQVDWMTLKGLYALSARAMDDLNVSGVSDPVRILVSPPGAHTIFYPRFTSGEGLILLGSSQMMLDLLRLNPTVNNASGACWLDAQHPVTDGFDTIFQFRITDVWQGGADGFALVVYGGPSVTHTGSADGLGYDLLTNSLAIELDTYYDANKNDPNDNHISVHSRGANANDESETASLGRTANIPNLSDGAPHTIMVEYVPGLMKIYLDNLLLPVLTVNVDLGTLLSLDAGRAWVGFTAGTGGSTGGILENHDILGWSFRSLTPVTPTAITQQPQSQTVLRGESVTFSVRASSYPTFYQWYFNDTDPIPGATGSTLTLSNAQFALAGDYHVVVSNSLGSVTSRVATLSFLPVVAWGANNQGQTEIFPELSDVVAIASGYNHNLVLKQDGALICWGFSSFSLSNIPAEATNVAAIACGGQHNLVLRRDGTVVGWGRPEGAAVPVGLSNVRAIIGGGFHSLALLSNGTVVAWGQNASGQTNVPVEVTDAIGIAAGHQHSLAIKRDGSVVAWGDNTYGQTDIPEGLTDVVALAGGTHHSLALKRNGQVVAWGRDDLRQTDVPAESTNVLAIAAKGFHSLALNADRTVTAWGNDNAGQVTVPPGLRNVIDIAGGLSHSLALVGAPITRPQMLNPVLLGTTFSVQVRGSVGRIYVLESKDSLADPEWTELATSVGQSTMQSLTDTNASLFQRFYRIRVQ